MTIKSYPKSELAQLYFPDSDPHVATNHLAQWIKRCSKNAKFFSPQAVRHIVEYLGEP